MDKQKDLIVKVSVIVIICIIGLLFLFIGTKFGLSVRNELREFIYNLKH